MYKNKTDSGLNNIAGARIAHYRLTRVEKTSQKKLADMMQIYGIDLDKNAIQRIEAGKRFITDIELKAFAKVLDVKYEDLLE